MTIEKINIKLFRKGGATATHDTWVEIPHWDRLVWTEDEDITEDKLQFQVLIPAEEEDHYKGVVFIRLVIEHGDSLEELRKNHTDPHYPFELVYTRQPNRIEEFFQVEQTRFDEFRDAQQNIYMHGAIKCVSSADKDLALDFLRHTFPAQVYDIARNTLGRELYPQQGGLLVTDETIASIKRKKPTDHDYSIPHDIAFILANGIPRLMAYDTTPSTETGVEPQPMSGIKLNRDANAGHLVAALIGDILWENNKWTPTVKLLDTFGFSVKFTALSEANIIAKYSKQTFQNQEFLTGNPKLLAQLRNTDAKPGDIKYITPENAKRFANQPVPILVDKYSYKAEDTFTLPLLNYISKSKDVPDVTQLYNAGAAGSQRDSLLDYSGDEPQQFWETFIGKTRIVGQNNLIYDAQTLQEGLPPNTLSKMVIEMPENLRPFLIGVNPAPGGHNINKPIPITSRMEELGFYTFERRIDGVQNSPYTPEVLPNLPAREVAIIVARMKRKTETTLYSFDLVPLTSVRAGDRLSIQDGNERGAIMHINKVTHRYGVRAVSVQADAIRLNP